MTKEEIIDVIHKTMYHFFDVCGDNEEVPMSDKDELLLSVNKAICNNIKALEESCEDAVSRKTIVEMLNARGQGSVMTFDHFIELLYKLPSVTPTQRWIPVKERLPETDGDYLLFGKIDDFEDEYYKFIGEFDSVAEKFGICRDCFDPNTLGCLGSDFYEYGEVLAWMPLPDDYKEWVEVE